jgi:hypothetical protein
MTLNYTQIKQRVKNAIKKNGSKCVITRKSKRVYNASTNEYEDNAITINGYAIMNNYDIANMNSSVIKVGDVNLMCTFNEEVQVGDTINFGDKVLQVINVTALCPNGSNDLYYDIQARK